MIIFIAVNSIDIGVYSALILQMATEFSNHLREEFNELNAILTQIYKYLNQIEDSSTGGGNADIPAPGDAI